MLSEHKRAIRRHDLTPLCYCFGTWPHSLSSTFSRDREKSTVIILFYRFWNEKQVRYYLTWGWHGGVVVSTVRVWIQRLAGHLPVWSLPVLPVSAWVFSGYLQLHATNQKCLSVSISQPCDRLTTCPGPASGPMTADCLQHPHDPRMNGFSVNILQNDLMFDLTFYGTENPGPLYTFWGTGNSWL